MFNKHVHFSKIITRMILTGLLGLLLLTVGVIYVFSQTNEITISPSHTRKVTDGQVTIYEHTLTNNTTFTDTFSLEVSSAQGWPVELVGATYPTGTILLPLQVGAQMTMPFQIRLTIPLNTGGITEITVITATSQTTPTVWNTAIDTTIVLNRIYLPLVLRRWPPVPYRATLAVIQGADDGNYSVSWSESPARLADTYILQEAKDVDFITELREVCNTAQQTCNVSGKLAGLYYYRVRGHNDWGAGEWSNVQLVTVPPPGTPTLNSIENSDQNNSYNVTWTTIEGATNYILQEDVDQNFSTPKNVYVGNQTSWSATMQTPGTYHYRVLANAPTGQSNWSNMQRVIIYPLFVGLQLRWDGNGYIRGSEYADVGSHTQKTLNGLTDTDTIRSHNYSWYDPNPYGWDSETWDSYYSVTTGYFKSSSVPGDPAWKWGNPWILPYDWQFFNGQTVSIDGQAFIVSGPYSGYTAFGKLVQYWKLVNRDKFLFWNGGGSWTQYIHPGDITLHYEAGKTRLLLYSNILRRYYYNGQITSDTVQYVENLTSANSFPSVSVTIIETIDKMEDVQKQTKLPERENLKPSLRR